MPRIPEEEIERVKRETDLVTLIRSRGIELKKHGTGNLIGLCPFHDDRDPSFIVTPDKGLFHCMGCGKAGNAIQFVQQFDGVSFRHAYEILAEGGNLVYAAPENGRIKTSTVPRLENPLDMYAEGGALLDQVADYYHRRLLKSTVALDYLRMRGLCHDEAIRTFKLGYADRSLGLRLPLTNRHDGNLVRERLKALGILRDTGHEFLTGAVIVPVPGPDGHTIEMYGRKIAMQANRRGYPVHQYLPGPHGGVWNPEAFKEAELVLCEAPLDALTLWVNGIRNVSFIYGTNGFTQEIFDAIKEQHIKRVVLAYDADESGNRAAVKHAERLAAHGIEVRRMRFPLGMDANEYALKVKPPDKFLQKAYHNAELPEAVPSIPDEFTPPACASSSLAAETAAKEEAVLERSGAYYTIRLGRRQYRIGGLEKNGSLEVMKITVRLRHGEDFHLDSLDLLQDVHRRRFAERAAEETSLEKELIKCDLGKLLLACERAQEARLAQALEPETEPRYTMTADERAEALELLKSPGLVERIGKAFDSCGLVGEGVNKIAAYLACTSRKLPRPLAVIIQSTSAAGKSALMEAVLSMFPEEESVKYSAMTGQSLYYLGETNLKHRILAIVEEAGAEKASYALKLLQSEGELTIASTGKDPHTGRMETQEYHVEGPVMIFLTTTAIEIDEELLNRCLVLTVDETREQTERIHALQRQARTLEGLRLRRRRSRLLTLMRNVQRLLEPVDVVNPFADQLTFTTERTRTRRDHEKYLTLIDTIALLHQHQRPRETDEEGGTFIRVTLEDIELANRIAPELLARSLDELPPQTRRLYEEIKAIVRGRCETEETEQRLALFSRREIRQRLGWSVTQVRIHLQRLCEYEHLAARYGGPGSAFRYELLTDCNEAAGDGHIGLIDVKNLCVKHTTRRDGRQPDGEVTAPAPSGSTN
jgi:DNA primase catalytic core